MMTTHWRSHRAHRRWLLVSAVVIGGFGPVFALGSSAPASGAAAWTLDVLAWPPDGGQDYRDPTTRFLSALTGGFLLGWGVMVLCLRAWVHDTAPEGVRRSLLVGALAWCALDSAGSLAAGQPSNAAFNVLVLLLVVGPMWRPAVPDPVPAGAVTDA